MRPIVNGIKQKYINQVRFAELDFNDEQNRSLVEQFKIIAHPGFALVDGKGKLVKRWIGIIEGSEFETALKGLTGS